MDGCQLEVGNREARADGRRLSCEFSADDNRAGPERSVRGKGKVHRIEGIEFSRTPHRCAGLVTSAHGCEHHSEHAVRLRVARIQRDGFSKRGFSRRPVPIEPVVDCSKRRLRLCEVRTGGDCARRRASRRRRRLQRRQILLIGVAEYASANPDQARAYVDRVRSRARRIRLPGGLSEASSGSTSGDREDRDRRPPHFANAGAPGGQPVRRETLPNLAGDCRAHLPFVSLQQAPRLVIVGLCPHLHLVRAREGAWKLHAVDGLRPEPILPPGSRRPAPAHLPPAISGRPCRFVDVRSDTPRCSGSTCPSDALVSSVRPSVRYSRSGSPPRCSNGRTAIGDSWHLRAQVQPLPSQNTGNRERSQTTRQQGRFP